MEAILGIAIFFVVIIQIMMVVKFFEIASDMKDIRNMLAKAIQQKKGGRTGSKARAASYQSYEW